MQMREATKAFVKLSNDVGGSGVKVKPNSFHQGVEREKTIAQIGQSLNTLGAFAADYGQEIRIEVHEVLHFNVVAPDRLPVGIAEWNPDWGRLRLQMQCAVRECATVVGAADGEV